MIETILEKIKGTLPEDVVLVAVSKTKPNQMILEAYKANHLDFGENKVQDLMAKHESLPKDIRWHFIGHLQSNKVKYVAPFIHLLHGIDSAKLLKVVQKEGVKNERVINVLLQVKIADEDSKFGLAEDAITSLLSSGILSEIPNVRIMGLMGMATNTNDVDKIFAEFQSLKTLFDKVKRDFFSRSDHFKVLSMGMSGDYELAVKAGSNMVRVGSAIFGERIIH